MTTPFKRKEVEHHSDETDHPPEKKQKVKHDSFQDRYAITFGEQSEIHVGGTLIGSGMAARGFAVDELQSIAKNLQSDFKLDGKSIDLRILTDVLPVDDRKGNDAAVLVIRGGIDGLMGAGFADKMYLEQRNTPYDRKYWDRRRSKTLNKKARHNALFGEQGVAHSADYKQATVTPYSAVPALDEMRRALHKSFGDKAKLLNTEGNHYYKAKACGIGFHGDGERKIVICCSLGASTTLRFCWRKPHSSDNIVATDVQLSHGDMYIMSEKASGYDWKTRSLWRLVHAAGAEKWIKK